MLTVKQVRELIPDTNKTDAELEEISVATWELVDILFEHWKEKKDAEKSD